jgi:hypothetical protein
MTDDSPAPATPRRLWLLASTPTPDDVITVRRCVGESFRDGDAWLVCDGACLTGNLDAMLIDLIEVPGAADGAMEHLDALAARLSGRMVGPEEAVAIRAGGWW